MNHKELLQTEEWQQVRDYVYEREEGQCLLCGAPGVDCHHLSYRFGFFNPDYIILVCRPCLLIWRGQDPNHLPDDNWRKPNLMKIAAICRSLGIGTPAEKIVKQFLRRR